MDCFNISISIISIRKEKKKKKTILIKIGKSFFQIEWSKKKLKK